LRSRWISRALLAGIAAVAVLGVVFALRTLMAQSNASSTAVIDDLVVANRILAHEIGVLDAYGHVSVRDPRNPNHYYLSRAISAGMVTAADIIEYDLDSKSVGRDRSDGYLERFIHGEVYKARPDVMAVIHAHSPELIAFGASSVPLRNMIHVGSFINDGVPIFDVRKFGGTADDMLIRNPALGKALAQALGNKTAMILFGHGVVVTAASLPTVVSNAYFLNMNDREPGAKRPPVTPAGAAANNRAWEYWKRQVTTK